MTVDRALGRRPATDERHLQRWSLTARTMPAIPTPVVLGVNWYAAFFRPALDGRTHWIGRGEASWGVIRGGHAICLMPPGIIDTAGWWRFYDQGQEGACVGFALSRMMSLLNRQRYDARWLYHEAQKIDEWPGEAYSGTSVRAGCDVARLVGMRRIMRDTSQPAHVAHGLLENRWAASVEEIAVCLSPTDDGRRVLTAGYVTILNSWGDDWPHVVRLPLDALERLVFREDGEATVVTDRVEEVT